MTDRATAAAVGTLFLVATIAGGIGLSLQESVVGGDDYLTAASAHSDRLATGVLLQLVMGVAVVAIAVVIYPVLRRGTERLAMAYVVARTLEAAIYVVSATGLLALITVSEKYVAAQDGTAYAALGQLVRAERDWSGNAILDAAVFTVGALVLNAALPLTSGPELAVGLGPGRCGGLPRRGSAGPLRAPAPVHTASPAGSASRTAGTRPGAVANPQGLHLPEA